MTIRVLIVDDEQIIWLHVDAADTDAFAHDLMRVQGPGHIQRRAGHPSHVLQPNAAPGYTQQSFDLPTYVGQTVRVYLGSKEDATLQTSFVVDDFAMTTP